ncbi:hypothetical protein Theba_2241 [Mesotoga prima MesG1.Ag.4.2]|uniref:Uncharacterized protein n=1 Tax=Mesotoga prima MesG1.Ag.4.2 TaxID=660470 RepID=I2F7G8_9BACT|nr:hypothetical protein Theba_2241 [Mesotoga prima MesG1.Ag.4.2]
MRLLVFNGSPREVKSNTLTIVTCTPGNYNEGDFTPSLT